MKPTTPAVQISDADRKRKILITDKCTMALKKWRDKGESFGVDRYRCSRSLSISMSAKVKERKRRPPSSRKLAIESAKNLSHLGRWDGNFPRPTFLEASGTDFPAAIS